jgi:archaellum component FlaC
MSKTEILERIEALKKEVEDLEKEQELLKFDLKEVRELNEHLSTEIDRLYQNISYLADTETFEE